MILYQRDLVLKVFNRFAKLALEWAEDAISLKHYRKLASSVWTEAPRSLSDIVSAQGSPQTASVSPGGIDWCRTTFPGRPGVLGLGNAHLLSIPAGHAKSGFDGHARDIYLTTRFLRPISYGRGLSVIRAIYRSGIRRFLFSADHLNETAVLLGAYHADCNNYFHFWVDVVADLWFLREMGIDLETIDRFLIPYGDYKWQREILLLCRVPEEKVVPLSSISNLKIRDLYLPVRAKGGQVSPTWLVRAIRETSGWNNLNARGGRKIYISRLDATRRPLSNERDVIDYLSSLGFEIHQCGGLSVEDQRQLFAAADFIITPHGAALTNIVWCQPATRVIEFLPEVHAYPCFHDLAILAGLDYRNIVCRQIDRSDNPLEAGIEISMKLLKECVR